MPPLVFAGECDDLTDKLAGKREYPSFGELIRMRTPGVSEVPEGWSKRDARQYSVVARGLYGIQLRRALEHLPREFRGCVQSPLIVNDSQRNDDRNTGQQRERCSTTVEHSAHHREFAGENASGEQSPNHRQTAEQRRGGVVDVPVPHRRHHFPLLGKFSRQRRQ
jgi:hypothetical protein